VTTYISTATMADTLEIAGETYALSDMAAAIEAASRVIDAYKGTRFYPTAETRKYTAYGIDPCDSLPIDDLCALTSLTVDNDGDGVYETTWVRGTDFYLEPQDADLTGKPWNQISLRQQAGRQWPGYKYAVSVAGTFGWATAPGQVTESCSILANRYLKRARETPYGIVTVGTDSLAMARLGRIDPDVAFMLDGITDDNTPTLIL